MVVFAILLCLSLSYTQNTPNIETIIDVMIKETPINERIAQLLMFSIGERQVDANSASVHIIQKYQIGGYIYFGGNVQSPEQLAKLSHDLKSYSTKFPLLIAIDEEGGHTSRLDTYNGFPKTYTAQELGDKNDLNFTKQCGREIGQTLRKAGIDINFAPSVDVNINPSNPIIGGVHRSFSANCTKVALHAEAFIDGMHESNVYSSIKHYPGHGSSLGDSHSGSVDVTKTFHREEELYPYKALANKTDLVMTAHVFNSAIDPMHPATVSYLTITGILRNELHFDGVVITDSLTMGAITQNYKYDEAVVLALNAGNDIILICSSGEGLVTSAINAISAGLANGIVTEQRINESFRRVMRLKLKLKN